MTDPDLPPDGSDPEGSPADGVAQVEAGLTRSRDVLARVPDFAGAARCVVERTAMVLGATTTLEIAASSFASPFSVASGGFEPANSASSTTSEPGVPATTLEIPLRARQTTFGALRLSAQGAFAEPVKALLGEWGRHVGLVLDGLLLQEELLRVRGGMEQVDLRLQDLVARIGHDLRAPMSAVLMWLHVARQATEADRNDALDAIEAGAREQNVLISELVDITRARVGKLDLHRTTVRLADLVDEVVRKTTLQAQKRGLQLQHSPGEPGAGSVLADQPRLVQSVVNVVSHAVRIAQPGQRMTIAWEVESGGGAGWARLVLRDAFATEDLPLLASLASAFSPAESSAGRDVTAVDFRLSFAREILALHGGTLSVEAGPPVAIVIRLPVTAPAAPPPRPVQ